MERASFLGSSYSGYYHREIPKEDEELTHVGPGTPCGEYLRRFWQPVVFLDELKELPVRIRVMGEDLVAFRDRSGNVGVLELHCSHRGSSLEFGRISERGLRCCYHGWLYDVDGKILETRGEPPDSTLKERLYHGAYPTYVYKGLVFVYMGPPDKKPEFPVYDTFDMPGYRPWVGARHMLPCNWLQVKENCVDPAHIFLLHGVFTGEGSGFGEELRMKPELDFVESPTGMIAISTRRVGDKIWAKMEDFACPNFHQFSESFHDFQHEIRFKPPMFTHWSVPVDDTHTMNFRLRHVREDEKNEPTYEQIMSVGQTEGPYEERQRAPGDYDMQVSQRPIAIHALEHLATTDRGVIMFRRMTREGIRAVQSGQDPKGLVRSVSGPIPTYAGDTIVRVPPAPGPEADRELLRRTGRELAEECIRTPLRERLVA